MPISRCPSCTLIITEEEAQTGVCPVCAVPLPGAKSAVDSAPSPEAKPRRFPWLLLGTVGLSAAAFLVWFFLPRSKQEEPIQPTTEKVATLIRTRPTELVVAKEIDKGYRTPEPKFVGPPAPVISLLLAPRPVLVLTPLKGLSPRFVIPLVRDDAVKIDGDLADWRSLPPVVLTAVERGRPSKKVVTAPKTMRAQFAYSRKALFVAVDAVDTSGVIENTPRPPRGVWPFWDNDGLEIFIDTLNSGKGKRGAETMHQFFALPFGTSTDRGTGGYESRILAKNGKNEWTIVPYPERGEVSLQRAAKRTPTGWSMEVCLPKRILRQGHLKPGDAIALELQLDTGTNLFYHWACTEPGPRASERPDLWNEIILGGSDARIELLGSDGKPTDRIKAGQPITVRLTDFDANMNPTTKEQISVALNLGGSNKTLTLNETGPDTGIFLGTLNDKLDPGPPSKPKSLIVEYLDKVRADGQREVRVQAWFDVASEN